MSIFLSILLQMVTSGDSINIPSQAAATPETLSFFDLLAKGGIIMIPLIILSFISIYLMVERYFFIKQMGKIDAAFITGIKDAIYMGNLSTAITMSKSNNTSIARMLHWGLQRTGKPIKEIEGAIETAGSIEISNMSKRLGYLGLIAGIAPMLGFVGTILGIIRIFYNISVSENISIGIIAGGLYEKMIASCTGLIVGIVAYAAYHYLNLVIEKFTHQAEIAVFDFINTLQTPNRQL